MAVSLSDSELDFIDGGPNITLDTLPRHSHFFNPHPSSSNGDKQPSEENRQRKLSQSLPIVCVEGRIEFGGDSTKNTRYMDMKLANKPDDEQVFSIDNRMGLAHDLGFLSTMPELCDVTFLVGEDRHPVCGVKAILAARSRYGRMLWSTCTYFLTSMKRDTSDGVFTLLYLSPYMYRASQLLCAKIFYV